MKWILTSLLMLVVSSAFSQDYGHYRQYNSGVLYYQTIHAPRPTYILPTLVYVAPYPTPYCSPPPYHFQPRIWVHPKVYVEGQPIRNFFRSITP